MLLLSLLDLDRLTKQDIPSYYLFKKYVGEFKIQEAYFLLMKVCHHIKLRGFNYRFEFPDDYAELVPTDEV